MGFHGEALLAPRPTPKLEKHPSSAAYSPDYRNTPSTTNLEEEEILDAPGKDGNASMPEQVKRPNPWRRRRMMTQDYGLKASVSPFCYICNH